MLVHCSNDSSLLMWEPAASLSVCGSSLVLRMISLSQRFLSLHPMRADELLLALWECLMSIYRMSIVILLIDQKSSHWLEKFFHLLSKGSANEKLQNHISPYGSVMSIVNDYTVWIILVNFNTSAHIRAGTTCSICCHGNIFKCDKRNNGMSQSAEGRWSGNYI